MGLEPESSSPEAGLDVRQKVDSQAMGREITSLERIPWSAEVVVKEKGDQDLQ